MTDIWHRIEPNNTSPDLEEGLQSRIADPLWMLARQWQLGEFRGEDAASPIQVTVSLESSPLTSFSNGAKSPQVPEQFASTLPLECRVEAEAVRTGPAAIRLAAEAGVQFVRRLESGGIIGLRAELRRRFSLKVPESMLAGIPGDEVERLDLLARRAIDGRLLVNATPAQLQAIPVAAAQRPKFIQIWTSWKAEYADTFREPGTGGTTWLDERLEYSFSVAASTLGGEAVLSAAEYAGGHMDWFSFKYQTGMSHKLTASKTPLKQHERMPSPVTFRGMPASRWWEMEDGSVYFGDIAAGPEDLSRLIVAEFATIYSDDWFMVPLRTPVGSLNRIARLEVVDTFGQRHLVSSTAANDYKAYGKNRGWRFFELTGDPSAERGETPWLFVAPALVTSLNGPAVEQVSMVRDEAANLAWGVEQMVESPTGQPLRRRQQWTAEAQAESPDAGEWRYRLYTEVPPWWIPFVPEQTSSGTSIRLRRGRMQAWDLLPRELAGAKGRILCPERPLRLYEEEIPGGGLQLNRSWQMTRGSDGKLHLWMARRKQPGRGERGSGLRMDAIDPSQRS